MLRCLLAVLLVSPLPRPAPADEPTIEDQVARLRTQIEQTAACDGHMIARETESYLARDLRHGGAVGASPLAGLTISSRLTAVIMGTIDEYFVDSLRDGSAGGGVSWDWWVTDAIGLFVRIATNGGDVNPVELDASIGAQFNGLVGSRPDDKIGAAIGFISSNDLVITLPQDTEVTIEVYYDFSLEGGKMHVTPHLMFVSDPGGGLAVSDQLWILGLRIHVPF